MGDAGVDGDETEEKSLRSHGERAANSLRAARRSHREAVDPASRAEYLAAEAQVLALLDVAAAIRDGDDPIA